MRKILYLTFYFEPDLCAGSFRNTPLAYKLAEIAGEQVIVHVITTQPNRYNSFRSVAPSQEVKGNLKIDRISIPAHKSGFGDQIRSFFFFFTKARQLVAKEKYDLVFASSSRMFTAYLGKTIAKEKKCPLYLDIRDIFVDTIGDVLRNKLGKKIAVYCLKTFIERPTFNFATHINLISEGFKPYFLQYRTPIYSYFPNGIDDMFFDLKQDKSIDNSVWTITYAGNIGEGQGLHKVLPSLAKTLGNRYLFKVIGDGGAKSLLEEELERHHVENVVLLKPMSREKIIEEYRKSHFLFLHLNDYNAFKKVLPSKIFEYAATDIPIIAGVSGYASDFLKKNVSNSLIFEPGDFESLISLIKKYSYHLEERKAFSQQYSREVINAEMAQTIKKIMGDKG